MKTMFRILAAGLAVSLAFVSCAKQEVMNNGSTSPAGGARTIAVSFANGSTKSALEGLQPKFVAGDVIKVSNGTAAEDCTVSIESGVASISTELTGELTAVYPSTAAKMNGNAIEGIIVSTVQDGTFASANICKATIAEGATEATFETPTAVFRVTPPSGVKKFTITSLKPVVDGVARTGTAVAINTEGADDAAKLAITAGGDASELTTFYVSLVAGVNLTDLSFEYRTDGTHGAMKGIPTKSIQVPMVDATAASTLYVIDADNWHPYVVMDGKKWATMNVGATEVTGVNSYGDYFMWGAVEKAYSSIDVTKEEGAFTFDTMPASYNGKNTTWDASKGFDYENCIYTDGVYNDFYNKNVFTKYTASYDDYAKSGIADGKNVLDLEDDAANFNWGGSWRMPTEAEFDALEHIDNEWDDDKKGRTFGVLPTQIFFPAAGECNETFFGEVGVLGSYWSSSLTIMMDDIPNNPAEFSIQDSFGGITIGIRNSGETVRPISD